MCSVPSYLESLTVPSEAMSVINLIGLYGDSMLWWSGPVVM